MSELIKTFSDGTHLEYDQGAFDKWCVYLTDTNGTRTPPRDFWYFAELKKLGQIYGNEKLYSDFCKIYYRTSQTVDISILGYITTLAQEYTNNSLFVDKLFTILYAAMIAEERKAFTKLGKRIKRLGMHKLLLENETVYNAANFMRGMGWRDIDKICKERGF